MRERFDRQAEIGRAMERLRASMRVTPERDRVYRWLDPLAMATEDQFIEEYRSRGAGGLSELAYQELSWHAMVNDAEHLESLQYFLPQLFEDAVAIELGRMTDISRVSLAMLSHILSKHQWQTWPSRRADALRAAWFVALREDARSGGDNYGEGFLANLILAGLSLPQIEKTLSEWPAEDVLLVKSQLLRECEDEAWPPDPFPRWAEMWGDDGVSLAHRREVMSWLAKPDLPSQLEAAYWAGKNADYRQRLSEAEERARRLLQSLS